MEKEKVVEGLGEYYYQCHPRWIDKKAYYCRMANAVMPVSRGLHDCYHCPLLRGFTQGEHQGLPECYYYDFDLPERRLSPKEEKERIDRLIGWYNVPEFPDYVVSEDSHSEREKVVERALQYAAVAHKGSFRKGTKTPYIVHPFEVAMIAKTITSDPEVIAAAALHDVVEDTIYTEEDIRQQFGNRVMQLVAAESEDKREDMPADLSWRIRKEEALSHLARAPMEAKLIALADKLSNMRAIAVDYKKLGDALWKRFNQQDPAVHGWYYAAVRDICEEDFSDTEAWKEYDGLIEEVFAGMKNI